MTRQFLTPLVVAVVGWFATLTLKDTAQVAAGFATAGWMVAQTYSLLRRQKCTAQNCPKRRF